MRRGRFELAIYLGQKFVFREREKIAGLSGPRRVLFMAKDISSVVARRFRNATEPITEISFNVDGDARTRKKRR